MGRTLFEIRSLWFSGATMLPCQHGMHGSTQLTCNIFVINSHCMMLFSLFHGISKWPFQTAILTQSRETMTLIPDHTNERWALIQTNAVPINWPILTNKLFPIQAFLTEDLNVILNTFNLKQVIQATRLLKYVKMKKTYRNQVMRCWNHTKVKTCDTYNLHQRFFRH